MPHRQEPDTLRIAQRFRGPHRSGNGGYTAGALARRLLARGDTAVSIDRPVRVTLRLPPPLETSLSVSTAGNGDLQLSTAAGDIVAQAQLAAELAVAPAPVAEQLAAQASTAYRGHEEHPFPFCFSCGTAREAGDALRLFAGDVPGRSGVAAAPWGPDAGFSRGELEADSGPGAHLLATPVVWAALDCPGAWATEFDSGRPIVLGRMTAVVHHELPADEHYVVVGERQRQEGRKAFTATAVYAGDGRLMAAAEAVWLAIDPETFAGLR